MRRPFVHKGIEMLKHDTGLGITRNSIYELGSTGARTSLSAQLYR